MTFPFCRLLPVGLAAAAVILSAAGCSNFERHKYVFWGDVVTEKPVTIEDHWTDYGPFKLANPKKKLRRGKAGVIRFFKEKEFVHSIPVDGELVVYVYKGDEEGVELTEPIARLILTSEQLNSQRKFEKKNGYSYHIWLDLGEIDDPPENISILTVFNDAKTRDQVASGITYTRIEGVLPEDSGKESGQEKMLDPQQWAKQYKEKNNIPALTDAEKKQLNIPADSNEDGETGSAAGSIADAPAVLPDNSSDEGAVGTVINLSPAMARQVQAGMQENTAAVKEDRFASYMAEKKAEPQMIMQNGAVPMTAIQTNPVYTARKPLTLRKPLTFDELRQATGPTADGQLYRQGYGDNSSSAEAGTPAAVGDVIPNNAGNRLY